MSFDDHLRDVLHDDRWALPVSPDTLPAVRRSRARRRAARTTAGALAVVGAVTGGALLVSGSDGPAARSVVRPLVTPPVPSGCSAPPAGRLEGSDYVVRSARDWFMTKAQSDAFFRTYAQPSPKPEDTVPSPQASGPGTDRLVAALTAAGVPGADALDRDEADSGTRGSLTLHGTLPDGRTLYVNRMQTLFPYTLSGYYGSDTEDSTRDITLEDVPGTGCEALLLPAHRPDTLALVQLMTPSGITTGWNSSDIPLEQLKQWAYAAAQWETEHPAS